MRRNLQGYPSPVLWFAALSLVREQLTAARTYYVATTGNNANDGRTAGSAWLTIQKAVDVVTQNLDLRGFDVTIQLADGTYTAGANLGQYIGGLNGRVTIQGNAATPANVIVAVSVPGNTGGRCFFAQGMAGDWTVRDVTMTTTGSGTECVRADSYAILRLLNVRFGACVTTHVYATSGTVLLLTSYAITAGAARHLYSSFNGFIGYTSGLTVTLTGTPAFSAAFAYSTDGGRINAPGVTWTGAATGSRFLTEKSGSINSNGGGANYFPGSVAGVPVPGTLGTTGGIYT